MFSVNTGSQAVWIGDDIQGGSLLSSASGQSRSEFDTFATENVGGKQDPNTTPSQNAKATVRTPGVLRAGDALLRNGQNILPAEKAFSIQIGWRLFRLSGASIMSDGKLSHC